MICPGVLFFFFFFQAEDGIRDLYVTGVQTCALPIISIVQNEHANRFRTSDPKLLELHPAMYMPMIDTAEVVAKRYGIGRDAQDAYSLESQRRTAAAQEQGRFDREIVPMPTRMAIVN